MKGTGSTSKLYNLRRARVGLALLLFVGLASVGSETANATHVPNVCRMKRFSRPIDTAGRLPILSVLYHEAETCIIRTDPKTGAFQRLANGGYYYVNDPTYSPDRSLVAFTRYVYREGSTVDLHVMKPDGTEEVRVATNIISFDWSPSSEALVVRTYDTPPNEIYIASADGSVITPVPPPSSDANWRACPRWSPDGTEISYQRLISGYDSDVRATPPTGYAERTVVGGETTDGAALWSPDGQRIAFARRVSAIEEGSKNDLFTTSSTGGEPVPLTDQPWLVDRRFAWSPDGSMIAYLAYRYPMRPGTPGQLWVAAEDGAWRRRVAWVTQRAEEFTWSPNGRRVIYTHDRDLWSVRTDGSGERRVTDLTELPGALARHPHWGSTLSCYAHV